VNAIVRPSGDQRGAFSFSLPWVNWTGAPPSTRACQMWVMRLPLFQSASLRAKTTSRPSGERRGSVSRGTLSRSTMPSGRGDCADVGAGANCAAAMMLTASHKPVRQERDIIPPRGCIASWSIVAPRTLPRQAMR